MPVLVSSGCAKFNSLTGECNECQAGYYKQALSLSDSNLLFTSAGTSTINSDVCQPCYVENCG